MRSSGDRSYGSDSGLRNHLLKYKKNITIFIYIYILYLDFEGLSSERGIINIVLLCTETALSDIKYIISQQKILFMTVI